jgi:hypothetical protein
MCVYVYVYACMYVCIYVYVCMYMCVFVWICICLFISSALQLSNLLISHPLSFTLLYHYTVCQVALLAVEVAKAYKVTPQVGAGVGV